MEQGLFIAFFIINFIIFLLAEIITTDTQKQAMYYVISGVFFFVLAIVAFDIEIIVYNTSTSSWVVRNEATYGYQYMYGIFFSVVMGIVCILNTFALSAKATANMAKGLKFPWEK